MNLIRILLLAAAMLPNAPAYAQPDGIISMGMHDSMRFTPARVTVRKGETLRLNIANSGAVMHELVLGTPQEIARHRRAMRRNPRMVHSAANMVHVAPGTSGSIVWTFKRSGDIEYACLLPGHYEAGMRGFVTVLP